MFDAAALLVAGGADVAHDERDVAHADRDLLHGFSGHPDQLATGVDLFDRIRNQRLDLLRRRGTALCQIPDFGRDHGKPASRLARARRLHRGVEGQDIGLEGNAVDDRDDLDDVFGRLADRIHLVDDPRDHLPAPEGDLGGRLHQQPGALGVLRVLLDGQCQLVH